MKPQRRAPLEQKSARLRYTEEIAGLVGFPYDTTKNKYGGFFSVYQLEQIRDALQQLRRLKERARSG